MRRFYWLDVQPDLFGGVLLMKEWGRIGQRGRIVAEPYDSEVLAAADPVKTAHVARRVDAAKMQGSHGTSLVIVHWLTQVSAQPRRA